MKRREFLKTSTAAAGLATITAACATTGSRHKTSAGDNEFYELRVYNLASTNDQPLLDGYLERALIPALNRIGSKPVGAFTPMDEKDGPAVYVVIPFATTHDFAAATAKVFSDPAFLAAGKDYLDVPKSKPAFTRIDSSLLRAFDGQRHMTLPDYSKSGKPRIFEMRTYESHSEVKALKKVAMFNDGEIGIMHEVGMGPIFFGQALTGSSLPHLTYMLFAENRELHTKHWDGFRNHPLWKKMSGDPKYADTVSKITNRFLAPTAYSQI